MAAEPPYEMSGQPTISEEFSMDKLTAKLGTALYVCWGLLHFTAAYGVYKLAQNSPPIMAQGRLMQTAFYLAAFAITAIVLAIALNWRNDRLGFGSTALWSGSPTFLSFSLS